jgi:DNA-binding response OmpR family regulator
MKNILMIEDEVFFLKLYEERLRRDGFRFSGATTGVEGVSKASNEHPDLILLDLVLPRKNGFDVLRDLKKNPATKNIPVIVLSNLGQEADITEAMKLGAVEYLIKTETKISEAVERIQKVLGNNASQK